MEGGQKRGSRKEGEALGQPSRGDGSRTAQSVSLTTLPKTGWLTHKHTLLRLNTKRRRSHTHTCTFCVSARTHFVEHAVLKRFPADVDWASTCTFVFSTGSVWAVNASWFYPGPLYRPLAADLATPRHYQTQSAAIAG